jgi:hypothetical protein
MMQCLLLLLPLYAWSRNFIGSAQYVAICTCIKDACPHFLARINIHFHEMLSRTDLIFNTDRSTQWWQRGWAKWVTTQGLTCLTPVHVCIRIAFSSYIVAVVCLIHVLLSETDNNEEGIEKVFNKSLWRVNDNFSNAFHKMLLLSVD